MKTAELTGALLDYWVAQAEGIKVGIKSPGTRHERCWTLYPSGEAGALFQPSTDWGQGGPIIDRDLIMLQPPSIVHYNGGPNHGWRQYDHWRATVSSRTRTLPPANEFQEKMGVRGVGRGAGETALLAAMRAKVASHYGDEVGEAKDDASS